MSATVAYAVIAVTLLALALVTAAAWYYVPAVLSEDENGNEREPRQRDGGRPT